ncbi:substrate-binding periplasmic protein [Atopomonas sediminilitoris]|uniref:substrate-binding periplasmic protein n=1 Tax=Atopomonas sediminilitoris TaxID=2919919 RepID=UPI001F4DB4A9|nr:transporter substrate-binding domain-containing protein [Atopomonas sediminilitoris]
MQPLYYLDQRGRYQGFANDLLTDFAKRHGYQLEIKALPVARLYHAFFNGDVEFKFPDSPQWDQPQRARLAIHYSDPVLEYLDGVMRLNLDPVPPGSRPMRLGIIRGFKADYLYDNGEFEMVQGNSLEQLYLLLEKQRIDGIFFNAQSINYQLAQDDGLRAQRLRLDRHLPYLQGHYRLSSFQRPEVIEQFDRYLLQHAAVVAQLKLRWGVPAVDE